MANSAGDEHAARARGIPSMVPYEYWIWDGRVDDHAFGLRTRVGYIEVFTFSDTPDLYITRIRRIDTGGFLESLERDTDERAVRIHHIACRAAARVQTVEYSGAIRWDGSWVLVGADRKAAIPKVVLEPGGTVRLSGVPASPPAAQVKPPAPQGTVVKSLPPEDKSTGFIDFAAASRRLAARKEEGVEVDFSNVADHHDGETVEVTRGEYKGKRGVVFWRGVGRGKRRVGIRLEGFSDGVFVDESCVDG